MTTSIDLGKAGIAGAVSARRLPKIAAAGDSIVQGAVNGGSVYNQAIRRATAPPLNVGKFSVPGTRTDQIFAQVAQAASAGATLLAINGGTNDIAQGVTEAVLRANLIKNFDAARALGMEPIDIGLLPSNVSAAIVARQAQNEIWRRLYCAKNGIRHADMWTPLATPAGAFRSGYNSDTVHPNSLGAVVASPNLIDKLGAGVFAGTPLLALTDTATDNGSFLSNAVSFSGGATPTGWFASGTGGTLSVTPADTGDLGAWLRCTVAGGVNAGFTPTAVTLASLGWSIGDKIALGFRMRWADTAQALSVSVFYTGINVAVQPVFQETGGANGNDIVVYDEVTITGGTVINLSFYASGTGYFEVNRPVIVNLTKLGLA